MLRICVIRQVLLVLGYKFTFTAFYVVLFLMTQKFFLGLKAFRANVASMPALVFDPHVMLFCNKCSTQTSALDAIFITSLHDRNFRTIAFKVQNFVNSHVLLIFVRRLCSVELFATKVTLHMAGRMSFFMA
jgi:hypothetical protein